MAGLGACGEGTVGNAPYPVVTNLRQGTYCRKYGAVGERCLPVFERPFVSTVFDFDAHRAVVTRFTQH